MNRRMEEGRKEARDLGKDGDDGGGRKDGGRRR